MHNGLDIGAPEGTPILLPAPGILRHAYQVAGFYDLDRDAGSGGYGRVAVVEHAPGVFGWYAHCLWTRNEIGAVLYAGDQVGAVGRSAGTAEEPSAEIDVPHLHLEFLRRWPLRSSDVFDRYDVVGTLANMGIIEDRGRFVWSLPPEAEALYSTPAPAPGPGPEPIGFPAIGALLLGAWLWSRRARRDAA